ncbi:hypothetical protein ACRAWF_06565 [Streptomyces sp. L7]
MPIQFTTDDSPGHRRLALWQDIVCDVFVGLDCKSDLGSASRLGHAGSLGKAVCSDVCSDRQHVVPSRIARSDQDYVLIALGNRGDGVAGRPRDRDPSGPVRALRHDVRMS